MCLFYQKKLMKVILIVYNYYDIQIQFTGNKHVEMNQVLKEIIIIVIKINFKNFQNSYKNNLKSYKNMKNQFIYF